MTCSQHELNSGKIHAFVTINHPYVPYTLIVDPNAKKAIDTLEGDWSMGQVQKKLPAAEKAMPGARVPPADYAQYKKALKLAAEGKDKEAQDLLKALSQKKWPEKFAAALKKASSAISQE